VRFKSISGKVFYISKLEKTQIWHKDLSLHRENNKPAVTYKDGYRLWYLNDVLIESKEII
jgi:hypothetical protein